MSHSAVGILLVEDNPDDVELTLHALRKFAWLTTWISISSPRPYGN